MNVGDRVVIKNTDSIWDDKEGIVENIVDDEYIVFVDFIPDQNKKIRQNFNKNNIFSLDSDNYIEESKKFKNSTKMSSKTQNRNDNEEKKYNLSSLHELKDALGENDLRLLSSYENYIFTPYVSDKFINNLNDLKKSVLNNTDSNTTFFRTLNRFLENINDYGQFTGIETERINGISDRYLGKIIEVKLSKINKKPIRILVFRLPDKKIVLGNVFYHSDRNLTMAERTSCNDIFDAVFRK